MGKQVKVTAGGMWQRGILLGITQRREVVVKLSTGAVQTLSPLTRIEEEVDDADQ